MTPFELMAERLGDKVSKVNTNNPKANSGAVLLKLAKVTDFSELIAMAFQIIQMSFTKDSSDSPAGTGKLTQVSSLIGYKLGVEIGRGVLPWRDQVRLGDLLVEAFKQCGYVKLRYVPRGDSDKSHYIVSATAKWTDLAEIPQCIAGVNIIGTLKHTPDYEGCPIKVSVMPEGVDEPYVHPIGVPDKRYKDTVWWRSVTKLQNTPWRINTPVYEALIANKDMFVSSIPIEGNDAKEQKRRSKNTEWGFITSKAKIFNEWPHFYQTMEADYRGRLYYCEPFLNYQGSDFARGMFQFAKGEPMTESGEYWLAVHTANSANMSYDIDDIPEWCEDYRSYLEEEGLDSISVDKFTLDDRVIWTRVYMPLLLEAGRTGQFIEDAEKPVSLLACCVEWAALHDAKADGRVYMSHLPIPIDGSNNGWQHLGAISKDKKTGSLVGLIPSKIQKDFYVETAKELLKIDDPKLNAMPMKHVRKGISKRGSMTRAYSAGSGKIAENMWFDCKTEDFHEKYEVEEDDCKKWAKELIQAINTVCPGPLQTMAYFQNLAAFEIGNYKKYKGDKPAGEEYSKLNKEIKELWSKKDKSDDDLYELNTLVKKAQEYESRLVYGNGKDRIRWTTPSGFPVTYTNYRMDSFKERGTIDGQQIKHVAQLPTKIPDMRGFMCGISPNYIHSQDASHMALVIDRWDGYFGAVHDSFSTHACDVEELLAITKAEFIYMYDEDNFYNIIRDSILSNQEGLDIRQPQLGSLEIQEIQDSDYFFA